ncbi:hypothetical protein [Acinetobacter sp. MD2]|uniref:hypothetical protein n=1 Tax=Acinetobacter sp. MD2 TaxID=2600066 RepID=UPI002D1F7781|nr:hypothetical protein [Acinetobacter sp. MD2]MEB3767314.1 hypothetical protein [Acinetobacter sp. MD2]
MRNLSLVIGLSLGVLSATTAFAEPAVQPGTTLESLSQATISTTVNGQPGSLKELLQSGKFLPVTPETATTDTPAPTDQPPAATHTTPTAQ